MAKSNQIITVGLGNQTIGLAEFRTGENGGLVLLSYQNRELLADPAADATRIAQSQLVLAELVQGAGLKNKEANYAISAQSVFTRFVKLPSVGEEQVDQIVTFEAQQNVPYPIDEVVWDYQLVDSGDSSVVEVVIVAIKSDLLDDINSAVEDAHLRTKLVDVAPMAVYNAFRYNYSGIDGCSLIIDIGARTTNLIFIEPHKVFSRSIPNAGATITQAIAKDFNEPFGVAEERKKRDGFVSLGGAYAEPDAPEVARVSKMIRNSMTRLHAEIARSISFYRSQQGGAPPQRVYLSGGSVGLPYIREFFQEKFQLPVEFFNPLRNVALGSQLDAEEIGLNAHRMGELVGLALRGTSDCPMELNLRPRQVVRQQELSRRRPFILLAATCMLLAIAGWVIYFDRVAKVTSLAKKSQLEPKIKALQEYENKIKVSQEKIKEQENNAKPLVRAVEERQYWVKLIEDLNVRLPKDLIWITNLEVKALDPLKDGEVSEEPEALPATGPRGKVSPDAQILTIKGLYLHNDRSAAVFDDFVKKLSESTLYTVDKGSKHYKRNLPNDNDWAYDFEIPLILKNPISLPTRLK
ncbi:MAG: type IV pilus assembly protein PilM [Verrucomicrobiota bacterium]